MGEVANSPEKIFFHDERCRLKISKDKGEGEKEIEITQGNFIPPLMESKDREVRKKMLLKPFTVFMKTLKTPLQLLLMEI